MVLRRATGQRPCGQTTAKSIAQSKFRNGDGGRPQRAGSEYDYGCPANLSGLTAKRSPLKLVGLAPITRRVGSGGDTNYSQTQQSLALRVVRKGIGEKQKLTESTAHPQHQTENGWKSWSHDNTPPRRKRTEATAAKRKPPKGPMPTPRTAVRMP